MGSSYNFNWSFAHAKNLCKTGAEIFVSGAKSKPGGNLWGFAGKTPKWAKFFLDKVITGDESWVLDYDPETKRQSSEWHTKSSPRLKKARMSRSKVKTMIIVFFDSHVLEQLGKRVQRVRTDIADDWVLHHDIAPAHTALWIREFLVKKNIPVLPHIPYSPDLAPCDFSLFPKLKLKLKGHHFWTMENIQKNCNRWATHTYGKWLPVLLWSVEETLEPLCNFPRVILRRR